MNLHTALLSFGLLALTAGTSFGPVVPAIAQTPAPAQAAKAPKASNPAKASGTPLRRSIIASAITAKSPANGKSARSGRKSRKITSAARKSARKSSRKLLRKTAAKRSAKSRKTTRSRPRTKWSKATQLKAIARCKELLSGLDVVVEALRPIRRNACGDPAPVRLIAIGSNPRVNLSPAPIVNCQMVAAMHKWLTRDLQPMARKYLRSPLKRLGIMSSYSCRAAYGKRGNKLSQHGRANALDIRSFETVSGSQTALLRHWGPRRRNSAPIRQIVTAHTPPGKAARNRARQRKRASRGITGWTTAINTPAAGGYNADIAASDAETAAANTSPAAALLKSIFSFQGTQNPTFGYNNSAPPASIFSQANRLGAAKRKSGPRVNKAAFLHAVHQRACSIFGTVLGPDANYTHRHHFHVDLQQRKQGPYCR